MSIEISITGASGLVRADPRQLSASAAKTRGRGRASLFRPRRGPKGAGARGALGPVLVRRRSRDEIPQGLAGFVVPRELPGHEPDVEESVELFPIDRHGPLPCRQRFRRLSAPFERHAVSVPRPRHLVVQGETAGERRERLGDPAELQLRDADVLVGRRVARVDREDAPKGFERTVVLAVSRPGDAERVQHVHVGARRNRLQDLARLLRIAQLGIQQAEPSEERLRENALARSGLERADFRRRIAHLLLDDREELVPGPHVGALGDDLAPEVRRFLQVAGLEQVDDPVERVVDDDQFLGIVGRRVVLLRFGGAGQVTETPELGGLLG